MALGAGPKAQGGISAIDMFFLAPDAMRVEPLAFSNALVIKIAN